MISGPIRELQSFPLIGNMQQRTNDAISFHHGLKKIHTHTYLYIWVALENAEAKKRPS